MTETIKQKLNNGLLTLIFVLLTWIAGGVGWLIKQGNDRMNKLDIVDKEMQKQCQKHDSEIKFLAGVQWSDPDTKDWDKQVLREISKIDTRSGMAQ